MLAGTKKVSGHRFALNASGCAGSKPSCLLSRGATWTRYARNKLLSTGTLGSTPERTQLVVLARTAFQPNTSFKHTSLQKDQLCADTIVCVLNKTWTRSKLQKVFPQRWPRRYAALSECRNATTFCHSQHANALFSKELGTLINSSFYMFLLSPHPWRFCYLLAPAEAWHRWRLHGNFTIHNIKETMIKRQAT